MADLSLVEEVEAEQAAGADAGGDHPAAVDQWPVGRVDVRSGVDVDDPVRGGQVGELRSRRIIVEAAKDEIDLGKCGLRLRVRQVVRDVGHLGVGLDRSVQTFCEVGLVLVDVVGVRDDQAVEAVRAGLVAVDERVPGHAEVGQLLGEVAAEPTQADEADPDGLDAVLALQPEQGDLPVDLWVPELGGRFDARNPSHKMLMSVLGGMSESERQHVRARVRAAMDAQVLNEGRHQGGRAPYGYLVTDGGPHPKPAEGGRGLPAAGCSPWTNRRPT